MTVVPLTVASFFSGVGLLDLGLEWAGWRTVSVSEIDPYACRILGLRFPDAPNLGDIHAIKSVPDATLWAGGFPCQPVSVAGKRAAQDDARWLWPRWMELIREFRPPYLLLENVSNLLAVNDGAAFGDVLGDLATSGYDAEWDCIPAAAVGAPHLRDRVWIVGYLSHATGHRRPEGGTGWNLRPDPAQEGRSGEPFGAHPATGALDDADREQQHRARPSRAGRRPEPADRRGVADAVFAGLEGHVRSVLALADARRSNADPSGPGWWRAEPDVGRVAHGVPHRVDRLRCLGNGVVPQVAEFIGWRLRHVVEAAIEASAAA